MNKLITLSASLIAATTMSAASQLVFIGTYTPKDNPSRGIYSVRLNTATGELSEPVLAAETPNPTFLALHPNGQVLYTIGESASLTGTAGGAALAFVIDSANGKLTALNAQPTGGASLCYVGVDATGKELATISYGGGHITSFALSGDARVGPRTSALSSTGALGPNKTRQEKPHPHSITYSPDNRFAYVCDLGRDKVLRFKVDPSAGTLTPAGEFATAAGDGPRHSKFSADGKHFYVINELANTLTHYTCDPATGVITSADSTSTLPEDFKGGSTTAEIRIHPNGRFVYGSNRGHDSIAVFARSPGDGSLKRLQIISSGGAHPRNFSLSPDGMWLICANRDTNNLTVFKVDPETGLLAATGHTANVPQGVCVLFMPSGK
jgi:6-phosphogluconolactonase